MDPLTIGALISGGSSILGGLMGKSSADANREAQQNMAAQNIAMQREFAQKGIQWKVEDAKAAGIHPLYALGASTHSFSPVSVGSTADNSLGEGIARAGQDIGRSFAANADRELRQLQLLSTKLDIESKGLANDIARAELASKIRTASQPATLAAGIPLPPIPPGHKEQEPQFTPHRVFMGIPIGSHPGYSDSQTGEDRHGEVEDAVGGLFTLPADLSYSISRHLGIPSALNIPDAIGRYFGRKFKR